MPQATHLARLAAVLAGMGMSLAVLTACSPDEAEPLPPESASSSAAEPAPTEPTDTGGPPAGWEDELTAEELQAYEAALVRWERYRRGAEPIYAAGKNTPAAQRFFKRTDLRWQEQVRTLEGIEQAGIRAVTPPEPLWAKAKSVKLGQGGTGRVAIIECTDYTDMRWERDNGTPVEGLKPETLVTPLVIRMEKPDAESDWLFVRSQLKGKKSCAG